MAESRSLELKYPWSADEYNYGQVLYNRLVQEIDSGVESYLLQNGHVWDPLTRTREIWYFWRQAEALFNHCSGPKPHRYKEPTRPENYQMLCAAFESLSLTPIDDLCRIGLSNVTRFDPTFAQQDHSLIEPQPKTFDGNDHSVTAEPAVQQSNQESQQAEISQHVGNQNPYHWPWEDENGETQYAVELPRGLHKYIFHLGRGALLPVEGKYKVKVQTNFQVAEDRFALWIQARTKTESMRPAPARVLGAYNLLVAYRQAAAEEHRAHRLGPYFDIFWAQYNGQAHPGFEVYNHRLAEEMELFAEGRVKRNKNHQAGQAEPEYDISVRNKVTGEAMSTEGFLARMREEAREELLEELLEEVRNDDELREQHYQDFLKAQENRSLKISSG
ncbi:uncharacterized protein PAC_13540 [Phialocephala subalpina]|uniref:Uncharacterized protein n=1 Tax=Phialocephala subalpina TaxID=576137 RepID=A0A1L7XF43_9HELO|nr:uncharacterized protein PAC_13540 [Phialocephala subalpina]